MKRAAGPSKRTKRRRPAASHGRPPRGSMEAMLASFGTWAGPPGEVDNLLREVQQMREADIALTPDRAE